MSEVTTPTTVLTAFVVVVDSEGKPWAVADAAIPGFQKLVPASPKLIKNACLDLAEDIRESAAVAASAKHDEGMQDRVRQLLEQRKRQANE